MNTIVNMLKLTAGHGWSWIICNGAEWLTKQWVIVPVVIPVHPGDYTSNTNATKFTHKKNLYIYNEYTENMQNTIKAFMGNFEDNLLIDPEIPKDLLLVT